MGEHHSMSFTRIPLRYSSNSRSGQCLLSKNRYFNFPDVPRRDRRSSSPDLGEEMGERRGQLSNGLGPKKRLPSQEITAGNLYPPSLHSRKGSGTSHGDRGETNFHCTVCTNLMGLMC